MALTQETAAGVQYRDLRDFIERVDGFGELKRINGANWQSEIGALTEINARRPDCKALLFDDIPGYPSGFRVISSSANTARRLALSLRISANNTAELVTALRGGRITQWQNLSKEFPPEYVTDGPVFEVVQEGAQVDLESFPSPVWHDQDGGRYIGTGNTVITSDPDTGWINAGCYRCMLTGKNQMSLWLATRGRHGYQHIHKFWDRGEAAPVVITLGQDPLLSPVLAGMELHEGVSELNAAGAIMGEPLRVVKGPVTGLPIPADAEIALEGWVREGVEVEEGPHGEGTGYYAGGRHMVPAIEVAAVYHRRDPIMVGAPPGKPPTTSRTPRPSLAPR
jgi:UbiD family decarboxylase